MDDWREGALQTEEGMQQTSGKIRGRDYTRQCYTVYCTSSDSICVCGVCACVSITCHMHTHPATKTIVQIRTMATNRISLCCYQWHRCYNECPSESTPEVATAVEQGTSLPSFTLTLAMTRLATFVRPPSFPLRAAPSLRDSMTSKIQEQRNKHARSKQPQITAKFHFHMSTLTIVSLY